MFRNFLFIILITLTGCAKLGRQIPIHQGNIVTQPMVAQLKPGMTKKQVLYVMGTPVIDPMFGGGRWDYLTSQRIGHQKTQVQRISLIFRHDRLLRIDGKINHDLKLVV